MKSEVQAHLQLVQAIIARMASNSFFLKGATVTVTAALYALAAKDSNPAFAVVALLPGLAFWGLDAYYLRQERLFRALYEDVRNASDTELSAIGFFSLSTSRYRGQVAGWFRTAWTPAVVGLHGPVVATIGFVLLIVAANKLGLCYGP